MSQNTNTIDTGHDLARVLVSHLDADTLAQIFVALAAGENISLAPDDPDEEVQGSRLDQAERLVLDEVESLALSAPRATLSRLRRIADDLRAIEGSL